MADHKAMVGILDQIISEYPKVNGTFGATTIL